MRRWLPLALLIVALPSRADVPALPDESYVVAARFTTNPTAVVVDVLDVTGATQIADNVAATQQDIDSVDSDVWTFDLNGVSGFADTCDQKTYVVRFVPDAANCQDDQQPDQCVDLIVNSGGAICKSNPRVQISYVVATQLYPAQGITQTVRDYYNRRLGQEPIRWREIRVANDLDFASPDFTKWEVYFYSSTPGAIPLRCTLDTETDPSVLLPSASNCLGS